MYILTSTVPTDFKQAVVTPLVKKPKAKLEYKNYRPVSNLPYVSKLLEKVISSQLKVYKQENSLDEPLQSAYKASHSTQTALLKVFNDILLKMDNKELVFLTLLDLSAAFDTVDHMILLSRLSNCFGVTGEAIKWIQSYLQERSQKVIVNGRESSPQQLECCVPQGSLLGPLLYSDYTRPLGKLLRSLDFQFHLYADDSQLITSIPGRTSADQSKVIDAIQNGVKKVGEWMMQNKLKLNEDKTEFIVFGTRHQLKNLTVNSIQLGGDTILRSTSARNLGVIMDQHLDMSSHVTSVCRVCYYNLRSIWKIRKFLTMEAAKTLVHALIISKLDYCNSLLYGVNQYLIDKLQKVQNAAARVVVCCRKATHISPILKELHWLPVKYRIIFSVTGNVFKALNGQSPQYINNMVSFETRSKITRSSGMGLLMIPKWNNKTCGKRGFSVAGPIEWNKLPLYIRQQDSLKAFKKELKTFFFRKSFS